MRRMDEGNQRVIADLKAAFAGAVLVEHDFSGDCETTQTLEGWVATCPSCGNVTKPQEYKGSAHLRHGEHLDEILASAAA